MKANIKEMKELIANQQLIIQALQKKVDQLEDTNAKREAWLRNAKREVGADPMTSFDDVWKGLLKTLKESES